MPAPDNSFQCPSCGAGMVASAAGEDLLEIHAPCIGCGKELVVTSSANGALEVSLAEYDDPEEAADVPGKGRLLAGAGWLTLGAAAVIAWGHFQRPPSGESEGGPIRSVAPAGARDRPADAPTPVPKPVAAPLDSAPGTPVIGNKPAVVNSVVSPGAGARKPAPEVPAPVAESIPAEPAGGARSGSITAELVPVAESPPPAQSPAPEVRRPQAIAADAGGVATRGIPSAAATAKTASAPPRMALEAFLEASDWRERLKFTQNPDAVSAAMEGYYKDHKDGPVAFSHITMIESDTVPDTNRKLYLYLVGVASLDADLPVSVEETADGFRVDWQTFIEGLDGRLDSFCAAFREAPGDFRVSLRRTHFFGAAQPWQTNAIAFHVDGPAPSEPKLVWVPGTSALMRGKLKEGDRLEWDVISHPVVRLQWRKAKDGAEWIELADIPADSWRSDARR